MPFEYVISIVGTPLRHVYSRTGTIHPIILMTTNVVNASVPSIGINRHPNPRVGFRTRAMTDRHTDRRIGDIPNVVIIILPVAIGYLATTICNIA